MQNSVGTLLLILFVSASSCVRDSNGQDTKFVPPKTQLDSTRLSEIEKSIAPECRIRCRRNYEIADPVLQKDTCTLYCYAEEAFLQTYITVVNNSLNSIRKHPHRYIFPAGFSLQTFKRPTPQEFSGMAECTTKLLMSMSSSYRDPVLSDRQELMRFLLRSRAYPRCAAPTLAKYFEAPKFMLPIGVRDRLQDEIKNLDVLYGLVMKSIGEGRYKALPSKSCSPTVSPCASPRKIYSPDQNYWSIPSAFGHLEFQIKEEHLFRYCLEKLEAPHAELPPEVGFITSAHGDLDCDGVWSTYMRVGNPAAFPKEMDEFYVENELE